MKWFVLISVLMAVVWLMAMLAVLEAEDYPRKVYHDHADDVVKAFLIAVYILVGVVILIRGP